MSQDVILETRGICKRFGNTIALKNIDLTVKRGEIHVLCGENGAGKSTLMNIISGVYPYGSYEGTFFLNGEECRFKSVRDSEAAQIAIIHQQLALIPGLSIAENIFAGNEREKHGVINWNETRARAKELMARVGLTEDPDTPVQDIGTGKQQLVEICKAISKDVQLLILDEPTASLNDEESEKLLNLVLEFKKQGITSILISHKLRELTMVGDAITVLRDGETIETLYKEKEPFSEDQIIHAMVGRELVNRFPHRTAEIGAVSLEIRDWNVFSPLNERRQILKNINMVAHQGEVLGIAGLMGAGRTELAMSIFGRSYGSKISGQLIKDGRTLELKRVSDAIDAKIAYVSEDRHVYGAVPDISITQNITLPSLKNFVNGISIDSDLETVKAQEYKKLLNIKCKDVAQPISALSGGNQQKVILGKWILCDSDILILDEPTRGIDVGAKDEIYQIINQLAASGNTVIFISSDMPEILGMCDRVYVMNEGEIVGELKGTDITQENIMRAIMHKEAI